MIRVKDIKIVKDAPNCLGGYECSVRFDDPTKKDWEKFSVFTKQTLTQNRKYSTASDNSRALQ